MLVTTRLLCPTSALSNEVGLAYCLYGIKVAQDSYLVRHVKQRKMSGSRPRSSRHVFEDHLRRRRDGDLEGDIAHNYAKDVVLLTGFGLFRGHAGVRRAAQILHEQLPCAK